MSALAIVDPIVIRCSASDRVIECAGSLEDVNGPFNPNNEEANEGTAAHAVLASVPHDKEPPVNEVADRFGVSIETLLMLLGNGQQAWREVAQWFGKDRHTEHGMQALLSPSVLLRGTTDLVALDYVGSVLQLLSVLDWKAGHQPSEHPNQLKSYAYVAREKYGMPASGYILAVEVWLRLGTFRVHKFTAAQLDAHRDKMLEQVALRGKQFGPGRTACRYCPRQTSCEALDNYRRSAVAALVPVAANQAITPEFVGANFERVKMLEDAIGNYKNVLKQMLQVGPVSMPDGRKIVLEEQLQDEIIPSKAQVILDELKLAPHEKDLATSVTKGGLEKVVKGRSETGEAAAAMRAVVSLLRQHGAIRKVSKFVTKIVA